MSSDPSPVMSSDPSPVMSSDVEASPPPAAPGPLILICGLPGAGKTTLAVRLERELPAVRFTEDEWVDALFPPEAVHDDAIRDRIHGVQWGHAVRIAGLGVDVVLDWGLWSRSERDDYRGRAAALGLRTELRFLDVPLDELWRRIAARNAALPPHTFAVTEAELDLWSTWFEPPGDDEDPVVTITPPPVPSGAPSPVVSSEAEASPPSGGEVGEGRTEDIPPPPR